MRVGRRVGARTLSALGCKNTPTRVGVFSLLNGHQGVRFRAKKTQLGRVEGFSPESQGQNLALTVMYVPCSLESGVQRIATKRHEPSKSIEVSGIGEFHEFRYIIKKFTFQSLARYQGWPVQLSCWHQVSLAVLMPAPSVSVFQGQHVHARWLMRSAALELHFFGEAFDFQYVYQNELSCEPHFRTCCLRILVYLVIYDSG